MRKLSLLLIVAIAAAASLAQPALAQDKAADVLAGMRQAIGAGKLDSLRTFSLEATTARNIGERQLTTDVELYLDLPDKYLRVDNVTAPIARTMTSGFNGDTVITAAGGAMGGGMPMVVTHTAVGGGAGGGGGAMTVMTRIDGARGGGAGGTGEMTPEQRAMMNASIIRSQRVDLSRLMLGWFGTAHPGLKATYTYAGEAESPDGKAHVISIKADGGFDAKLFIDQATNMPLMLTYEAPEPMRITRGGPAGAPAGAPVVAGGGGMRGGGPPPPPSPPAGGAQQMTQEEIQKQIEAMRNQPRKMIEHRVYFGDWKEVDGIQFPHSLQRATGETTTEEWTITKVKVNPKIDAKKFQ